MSNPKSFFLPCFLLLVVATLTLPPSDPGYAQSGRRPRPPEGRVSPSGTSVPKSDGDDELTIATQEVLLSVTVRDIDGRPVTDLTGDDFIIAEDRTRQTVESFSTSTFPVNVLLLLDASGSVFSERASIRKAAADFVRHLGPEDKVSVIQFADKVELLQDWTTNREDVALALNWRYRGGEMTDLWDALYVAATDQLSKVEGRRAVIVLTDGVDTTSRVTYQQALGALDRADTSVYVVSKAEALIKRLAAYTGIGGKLSGTAQPAGEVVARLREAEDRLRALSDRYGGRLLSPVEEGDLGDAYAQVARELKEQYVITYVSTNEKRDGTWRAIEIFLTRPGLTVRTRKGYVAR